MKIKKFISVLLLVFVVLPLFSSAQGINIDPRCRTGGSGPFPVGCPQTSQTSLSCSNDNIQEIIICVGQFFNRLIPITVSAALLVFLWGVFKVVRAQGDTKAIEEGRKTMLWGIIALFVMVSVWGLVAFIQHDIFGGAL